MDGRSEDAGEQGAPAAHAILGIVWFGPTIRRQDGRLEVIVP
jgi:hypothetical protein